MAEPRFYIDLPVRNRWANVELLRGAILNCFSAVFSEIDSTQSISTVISELLENAIKYGYWQDTGRGTPSLRLSISGDTSRIAVTVEHPVDPAGEALAQLKETLAWLSSQPSAAAAYRSRLTALADAEDPEEGMSRLGLARIAYEAGCRLNAEVSDDHRLKIACEMNL